MKRSNRQGAIPRRDQEEGEGLPLRVPPVSGRVNWTEIVSEMQHSPRLHPPFSSNSKNNRSSSATSSPALSPAWLRRRTHNPLCHPLVLLPSNYLNIRVFSSELALHIRWQKYRSFNFSISTSNEYSRLISLRTDCFDFLAVQGTHKGLQQNLKASVLRYSAVFIGQLSHLYMTTGKTIALTIWTFVGEVMSMLFNTLGLS